MKSLSVLIVEDEMLIADTIATYLTERGHEVLSIAISYDEAVKAYALRKPDIILLDLRLYGDKSGLDFAKYLHKENNSAPFIFLTSQYDKRIVDLALNTNPHGYLTKPISKESLWTTVESAAQMHFSKSKITAIYDGNTNHKVKTEDILYLQADHVYVNIHTINEVIVARNSLHQMMTLINSEFLLNCHRSYVVNIKHLTKWTIDTLILNNTIAIPLSRSRRNEVMAKIASVYPS